MRQGIIIFADVPARGGADRAALLKATVAAAIASGASTFVAYARPESSEALRAIVGGPPPRFFPQATRATLGERMAQAFAFLFVQDYEHVVLLSEGDAHWTEATVSGLFEGLKAEPVSVANGVAAVAVALRRPDFPRVAAIFEQVAWERPGATDEASRLIDTLGVQA